MVNVSDTSDPMQHFFLHGTNVQFLLLPDSIQLRKEQPVGWLSDIFSIKDGVRMSHRLPSVGMLEKDYLDLLREPPPTTLAQA